MNINQFFNMLAANPSRNFKIEQLKLVKDDDLLRDVIRMALDPFLQFYIRRIPAYTTTYGVLNLRTALTDLLELSNRVYTGHEGIEWLRTILSSISADDAKVIERIIDKSLDCGVEASTVNKVWPNLIPEFPVMLCSPYEEKLVNNIKFPAFVQKKEDGMRFNAIIRNGMVEFRSRNGKLISLHGNLETEFLNLADCDCVYDGELLVMRDGKILDRKTGNGILNKANKGTISKDDASGVIAVVWDCIPPGDFNRGKCDILYKDRIRDILHLNDESEFSSNIYPKIRFIETHIITTLEDAQILFQEYLSAGHEGIILKDMNSIWEDKRSKSQIKFKAELDLEAEVIGWEEGTGKYIGKMGSLVCQHKDINFSLGSGFDDAQRLEFTKEYIVGKIVTVKYNAVITDKTGKKSLFLPIFLEERSDKDSI